MELFQAEGAEVLGLDISDSSSAQDHLQVDLADPDCGRQLLEFCGDREVVGLVNNAGIGLNRAAVDTTLEEFDRVMAVNLRAPFLLATALQPALASAQGFIVNIASVHASATSQEVAMTRALSVEWAPEIRVNAVAPGAIDTAMLISGLMRTETTLGILGARHPLERVGSPAEVAEAVLFLAVNQFTTGVVLTVDGGATAHLSTE